MCSNEDELLEALSQLSLQSSSEQRVTYIQQLIDSLGKDDVDRSSYTSLLIEKDLFNQLHPCITSDNATENSKAAELVAEISKINSGREACVENDLVPLFVSMLNSTDSGKVTQACRSLGNICFEYDLGREAVDKCDGIEKLANVLKDNLNTNVTGSEKLRTVSCGFLLNLTNTHEGIQDKAINLGVIEILKDYLEQHADEENTCRMALLALGNFADTDTGKSKIESNKIPVVLTKIIDTSTGESLQDTILEVLGALSESEEIKLQLAENGICDKLFVIVNDNSDEQDEDNVQLEKLASDLIVLLLTGDKSMDVIYSQATCYKNIVTWLNCDKSDQLQISGALAVGNIARNEKNCEKVVKDGITEKLLLLLRQPNEKVSATLQHGVFSALRNMAIPIVNKAVMLKSEVLQCVLPYANSDMSPVQFKLLGLLRMLVDGQESAAIQLGTDQDFMSCLVAFCAVDEHAGVKGEACRLLSWLIKHSRSSEVMKTVVQSKGVHHLVTMATSEHVLMQNEALIAINFLSSTVLEEASEDFISRDLINVLKDILEKTDTQPEMLCNVITVVNLVIPCAELKQQMINEDFISLLKKPHIHSPEILNNEVTKALQGLESN